jgi:hypothetical protein
MTPRCFPQVTGFLAARREGNRGFPVLSYPCSSFGEWSCATHVPTMADPAEVTNGLVVGRVLTFLTGERSRRYLPEMRFLELEDQDSRKRFQVEIDSPDQDFAISLPPGRYRLTRVQVSEGPFLSMAELSMAFTVDASAVTYVGTWRFGVDSPRYGRMIVASMVADQAESAGIRDFLIDRYPDLQGRPIVETLPQPLQVEARLYEVMPYPRYPRCFRRHWW